MPEKYSIFRSPFLTWLFANILGFATIGASYFLLPSSILMAGIIASSLIIAVPIGLSQWLALRRFFKASVLWSVTVLFGFALALWIGSILPPDFLPWDDESTIALTAGYLILGFCTGFPQWLLLRPHLPRASLWLLASSLGAAAALWFVLVSDLINRSGTLSFILAVLIYAAITGTALSTLMAFANRVKN